MNKLPKSKQSNIVVQDLECEVLIYDLKANKAYCLNETSKMVWELCNGKNSVAEITAQISNKLKENVSEDIVYLAVEQFEKDGLLENENSEFSRHFAGMSRREVIRKVGFASMIALPIISAIVAPSAMMAASGVAVLGACTTTSDCQPGLNCKPCSFNCPTPACCANASTIFTLGPGAEFAGGNCGFVGTQICCSGSASSINNGNCFCD